jgi:hypothetical protein
MTMRRRNLLLIVVTIMGLVVALGLHGCGLLGGDDEAAEGEAAEGAAEGPAMEGEAGPGEAPSGEAGEMPGEGGMGGAPPPGMDGAPAEDTAAPTAAAPADAGGGNAEALVDEGMAAKHAGDYVTAREKFEAAIAADPDNGHAHWGLAWIYAEMAASGQPSMEPQAIEQFQKFLEIGGTAEQVAEAEDALERMQ